LLTKRFTACLFFRTVYIKFRHSL